MKGLVEIVSLSCGKEYQEYPALSRIDNKTEICPKCGMKEALEAFRNN